jgi:hypothetical protein
VADTPLINYSIDPCRRLRSNPGKVLSKEIIDAAQKAKEPSLKFNSVKSFA